MAETRGVAILQNEIEKAKDKLKDVNENIKKLTGRDPLELSRPGRGRLLDARGRGRLFSLARRGIMPEESGGPQGLPVTPRRFGAGRGAFSRLGPMPSRRREREDSGDEDEPPSKLSVHSSVIATSKDNRSREDTLAQQSKDSEGLQRNRRMFGLLLGTLQKFKREATQKDEKIEQRKVIEKKLEEKAEKEKRRYFQETQMLIEESQLEQAKITRLQQKMELVSEYEVQTNEMKKLYNFICTKARPHIFFKPKQMTAASEARLKDSKKMVDKMIAEKSKALEREINEIMEREHEREERLRSRLRIDKENDDEEVQVEVRPDPASAEHKDKPHRKTHDKKESHRHGHGHKEAKKKPQEMQYDDGEEEEVAQEEVAEKGRAEGRVGGKGKRRERKASHEGEDGRGEEDRRGDKGSKKREKEAEKKEKHAEKSAAEKLKESIENDGHHTDVDYEDEESSSSESGSEEEVGNKMDANDEKIEEEFGDDDENQEKKEDEKNENDDTAIVSQSLSSEEKASEHPAVVIDYMLSAETLAAIPMPGEPTTKDADCSSAETGQQKEEAPLTRAAVQHNVGDGDLALEVRRRQAVMAEDAEEMEHEPAADE